MSVEIRTPKGQPLTTADRSNAVAESLRQIARASRFADRNKGIRSYQSHVKSDALTPVLFVVFCLVPSLLGAVYYGLIASDRYVTEARFALRPAIGASDKAAEDSSSGGGSGAGGMAKLMIAQDSIIATNYIGSRPMVETLEKHLPVREMFAHESIDRLSRIAADKPIETFLKYWQERVTTTLGMGSGIITLHVEAFDAQESLALAQAILKESERMLNDLSYKLREDALAETKRELARAEARLDRVRFAVRDLRNRDGTLDASKTNEANLRIVGELRKVRIEASVQLTLAQRDLSPDSRRILDLKAQIRNIDENIEQIERQTTSLDPERRRVLSDSLMQFESFDNERTNAEKHFTRMLAAYERSRIIAERQVEFFSVIVEPVLPQSPEQPRRLLMISLIFAGSLAAFALAVVLRRYVT